MRIAVLGAGALGSWFGGLLALNGNDVQLLTTNVAHREAINANGLTLRSPDGEQNIVVEACSPAEMSATVELILVMTKTFQTSDALASIASKLNSNTHLLSLQNGLGNAETIAQYVPLEQTWIGVTMAPVDKVDAGIVEGKGHGSSNFGNAAKNDAQEMGPIIESTFKAAQIDIKHDHNVHQHIWEKVAFNAGMNALTALSHGRPRTIGETAGATELARNVAEEVATVAATQNINVNLKRVYEMINLSCTEHGEHIPSMLQDLLSKRRTEVDALNGAVVKIASKAGLSAPLNSTLTTLVRLAELSHQQYT